MRFHTSRTSISYDAPSISALLINGFAGRDPWVTAKLLDFANRISHNQRMQLQHWTRPYATKYITSFTAFTTRTTLGRLASIRVGVKGKGVSAWFTRSTGASK